MLAQEVARLRKLRELDTKAYKTLKTRLPYFVGTSFVDGIRHSDKFVAAHYLTIDVDDYLGEDRQLPNLVLTHPMVLLAFISPSGTGFKAVFRLSEPCQELALYKEFYRNFSRVFAENIRLAGSVDMKTCDATRACFLSSDANAYFNDKAESVDWQKYVSFEPLETTDNEVLIKIPKVINEEALTKVLDKISPNRPQKKVYQGYVPDELQAMQTDIERVCKENNWQLDAVQPISYGIKIQIKQGYRLAEINVFYGKKGFTLARSPKTGTDTQLAECLFVAIHDLIFPPTKVITGLDADLSQLLSIN